MSIEQIFRDKTQDGDYQLKEIKDAGKKINEVYSAETGKLKTDIKSNLDDLQQDVELKAIKEANERMRQLPNNKNKIGSIQEKIKQLKPESASTDTLNTITTALQLITGSDETLKTIVGNHETLIDKISKIKSNVLYFQRCGENDWEVLKGLCKECSTDTFSNETLKTVCYLQAMSQDYFNPEYGVDGVVGGNTLNALDAALKLMTPATSTDKTKTKETQDKTNTATGDNTKTTATGAVTPGASKEKPTTKGTEASSAEEKKLEEEGKTIKQEISKLKTAEEKEKNPTKKAEITKQREEKQKKAEEIVKQREKIIIQSAEKVKDKKETKETANVDVETPEILKLKKDISEHFKLNNKDISRETDISNAISKKDGKFSLAINEYTNIVFSYRTDKDAEGKEKQVIVLEQSIGGVAKGLLKYNVAMQTAEITKPEDKANIATELNTEVSQKELNEQFKKSNPDYEIKNSTDISEDKIILKYKPTFIKDKTDETKPIEDEITIELNKKNEYVVTDNQGNGKFNQWQKKEGKITIDQSFIFDPEYKLERGATKVVHYAQSKLENGETKLNIINNVQKEKGSSFASIYPEHTEMTDPDLNFIKKDFENNKIEKIFDGKNENHKEDFQNNWKVIKNNKGFELDITFVTNHGKEQILKIPFTYLVDAKNTNQYTLTPPTETTVDGIVYDIIVPKGANKTPDIKMQANDTKTLELAKEKTKIAIESNIFTGIPKDRGNDIPNTYNIQLLKFSTGNVSFDGKGGYKKELLLGEKKDTKDNIMIPGKKVGEIYFDQDYKLIHVDIPKEGKKGEIDFVKPENIGIEKIQEDMQGKQKGILLKPDIKGRTLTLNFESPKTPEEKEKNRETPAKYEERLREERQTLFEGLKSFSTILKNSGNTRASEAFLLPKLLAKNETEYKTSKIMGPDANGVYLYKIANADTKNAEQILYFQIEKENIILSNSDGKKKLDIVYIRDNGTKDIYEVKAKGSNIAPRKIDKAEKDKIPEINSDTISYTSDKVAINVGEDNIKLLSGGIDSFTYGANGKEMLTVYLDKDKKLDIKNYNPTSKVLIPQANNNPERVLFGSYEKYFAGERRNEMGITEQQYEEAFTSIYDTEASKDSGKTIAQVKVWSTNSNKYYYDYMQISQSGNEIKLRKLEGIEKTKEIMKERLNTLVQVNKLELSPTKGDQLRGTKLNNQDTTNKMIYLKTGKAEINLGLTANDGSKSVDGTPKLKVENGTITLTNKDITLGEQKIKCSLKEKDKRLSIKLDLEEQKAEVPASK